MRKGLCLILLSLSVWSCSPVKAEIGDEGWGSRAIDRISIGTRITGFSLTDSESSGFVGSINHLDEVQDFTPLKIFADIELTPSFFIEVAMDKMEAETTTYAEDAHSDGNYILKGPIVSLFYQWHNSSCFVPYIGAGVAFLDPEFEAEDFWHLGWHHPADYDAAGRPEGIYGDRERVMNTDADPGYSAAVGCIWNIRENIALDAVVRYTAIEVDSEFISIVHGRVAHHEGAMGTVPFDNIACGVGVRYQF